MTDEQSPFNPPDNLTQVNQSTKVKSTWTMEKNITTAATTPLLNTVKRATSILLNRSIRLTLKKARLHALDFNSVRQERATETIRQPSFPPSLTRRSSKIWKLNRIATAVMSVRNVLIMMMTTNTKITTARSKRNNKSRLTWCLGLE